METKIKTHEDFLGRIKCDHKHTLNYIVKHVQCLLHQHVSTFTSAIFEGRKNFRAGRHAFPSGGGTETHHDFVPLHQGLLPPQKFPEDNRENIVLLFFNNSLLLKVPPISQPPRETLGGGGTQNKIIKKRQRCPCRES